jgi:hypothetical protein
MRIADLNGAAAKLEAAMESLQLARGEAAAVWDDAALRWLEEHYFAPLETKYRRAIDAMRRLARIMEQATRECDVN